STRTRPSVDENATMFVPPPSMTVRLDAPCPRSSDGKPKATVPSIADFSSSLRCMLNLRNRPCAVAEFVALNSYLLQQRQMEIRDRRFLGKHEVLAAELHFAVPTTDEDVRFRIVVVPITVAHIRPEQKDRVVEQCSLSILCRCHLAEEFSELRHVPGL